MIALIDCNNFYASCEKVMRPDLKYTPVVVLSNNDGCIIARSQEAKEMGLNMTAPFFKIQKELKNHGVEVFSSNYTLYGDMSTRVVECIDRFSDEVEVYSVDEAFAKFTFKGSDAEQKAIELRKCIYDWVGIPVKVGLGKSKTLAKIAAKHAKRTALGVFSLLTDNEIESILKETKIQDLWGVGRGFRHFLNQRGVETAWEFQALPNSFIRKHLGVVGLRMAYELRGLESIPIKTQKKPRKNIMTSRSFSHAVTEYPDMSAAVANYTARCAEKLRNEGLAAGEIAVFLRTYEHQTNQPQRNVSLSVRLSSPTESTPILTKAACHLLKRLYLTGFRYKKVGVLLGDLEPIEHTQLNLFRDADKERQHDLMNAMDAMNKKYGKPVIKIGTEGRIQSWQMSSNFRSKRATTNWNELVEV